MSCTYDMYCATVTSKKCPSHFLGWVHSSCRESCPVSTCMRWCPSSSVLSTPWASPSSVTPLSVSSGRSEHTHTHTHTHQMLSLAFIIPMHKRRVVGMICYSRENVHRDLVQSGSTFHVAFIEFYPHVTGFMHRSYHAKAYVLCADN